MKTIAVEILGVGCLTAFAFAVWPPASLLVVGVACLLYSWRSSQ